MGVRLYAGPPQFSFEGYLPTEKNAKGGVMTLCPIALVATCAKCPAVSVCPLKGVIGDYKKPEAAETTPPSEKAKP